SLSQPEFPVSASPWRQPRVKVGSAEKRIVTGPTGESIARLLLLDLNLRVADSHLFNLLVGSTASVARADGQDRRVVQFISCDGFAARRRHDDVNLRIVLVACRGSQQRER